MAARLGLTSEETATLVSLCGELTSYRSYAGLREAGQNLARQYRHVDFGEVGHSSDYPEDRPIGALVIDGAGSPGETAYIQGPEHGPEKAGPDSAQVFSELMARHPELMHRLGYSRVVVANHIDPDAMELQEWGDEQVPIRSYVEGAYRGSWRDQVSWGYPTDNYRNISPENKASLGIVRAHNPNLVGSMHASQFASYVVVSGYNQGMAEELSGILRASGLPLNPDEPESRNSPVLAPAVFGTETAESYRQNRGDQTDAAPAENELDGGTNITEHLPAGTTLLIPEISMHVADYRAGNPVTGKTYMDMVVDRSAAAGKIIQGMAEGLRLMRDWPGRNSTVPEIRRLHNAARWWESTIPSLLRSDVEAATQERNTRVLREAEFRMRSGLMIVNSLVYAGNVLRLARMGGNSEAFSHMSGVMDRGLEALGPTRQVDIKLQVATQVLLLLATLKNSKPQN